MTCKTHGEENWELGYACGSCGCRQKGATTGYYDDFVFCDDCGKVIRADQQGYQRGVEWGITLGKQEVTRKIFEMISFYTNLCPREEDCVEKGRCAARMKKESLETIHELFISKVPS